MSDYPTNFPPQTYSSSFYINALTEGDKRVLVSESDEEDDSKSEIKVKNSPILDCFISTMKNCAFLLLVAFLSSNEASTTKPPSYSTTEDDLFTETLECVEDKSAKIRTFANLTEYQGNKNSFDPRHKNYQGNIVQFSTKIIPKIVKNSFISLGSDNIMKLDLHGKSIEDIEDESFKGLFCLQKLDLNHNNLSKLSENSFAGLENLEELDLSFNLLKDVTDSSLAFIKLKSLKVLDLSHNKITVLDRRSFMILYDLKVLNIGYNDIKNIDPKVFNYLESLEKLFLNDNDLIEISAGQWKGLTNLTDLDLSNNYLSSFDMNDKYSFINLKNLNLSGNELKDIDIYSIRTTFPNLTNLDLSQNSWYCGDLTIIKRVLKDSKITLPRSIDCNDDETGEVTTSKQITTSSVSKFQRGIEVELLRQNNQILETNEHIVDDIESLRNVVMCLLVALIIFSIIVFTVKMGICRSWYSSVSGRNNRGYIQTSDVESVGLITR
ncbi:leucine-rich repeat neuronal protein 2 isoform X1 [Diorhabda carinulata]|uniref:leucine-rich repeat neuronal protein 2 isoform X1 n=1 Tax=Diorhabda carinulata TaxID=1163345 RepID=UPI0025A1286E|nr:leucine-rich repeat neuronal protein 2 isoform X1 [Diorhabda carinulata]